MLSASLSMCGIGALLQPRSDAGAGFAMGDEHLRLLARRGPDVQRTLQLPLHSHIGAEAALLLYGSVLSMRGTSPLAQPLVSGSLHLLWNGEVYSGIHIPDLGNDGEAVLFALASEYAHARALVSGDAFMQEFSQRACALMSRLNGPFAFVLYDQDTQCLWFGRDAVGRRSLLTRTVMLEDCAAFCAASVSPPQPAHTAAAASPLDDGAEASDDSGAAQDQATDMRSTVSDVDSGWMEVAPSGMWRLHLQQHLHCTSIPHAHHIPWITPLPPTLPFGNDNAVAYTDAVLDCLENSVRARALVHSGSCGIGILFSGGLDCMIIAALAARCAAEHTNIDLFNVAFDAAEAPDRESACAGFIELCILFPSIRWRLFAHDVGEHETSLQSHHIFSLIHPCRTNMDLSISTALWFASRGVGVIYERHHIVQAALESRPGVQRNRSRGGSSLADDAKREQRLKVLISNTRGTCDPSPHLILSHYVTLPLLQVSLERKERQIQEGELRRQMKDQRNHAARLEHEHLQTALESFATLGLAVDVASSTSQSHVTHASTTNVVASPSKDRHSQHRSTVAKNRQRQLQEWAAARPTVPITSSFFTAPLEADLQPSVSPTRVLLSGLGADELCGGYARYRTAHRRGGDAAARASMKADVDRIWLRNLGRDDRIISDNGREMRTPYLDSSFIALMELVPTSLLIDVSAPSGVGDKIILRQIAAKIGLHAASERPKRAIQFGCRIAKQLNRSFFGASCGGRGTAIVAGLGAPDHDSNIQAMDHDDLSRE